MSSCSRTSSTGNTHPAGPAHLEPSGLRPKILDRLARRGIEFLDRLARRGIEFPARLFRPSDPAVLPAPTPVGGRRMRARVLQR